MSTLYSMDSERFQNVLDAFGQARDRRDHGPLMELAKDVDFPGFGVDQVLADLGGPRAGIAFRTLVNDTCRGDESVEHVDVKEVRDSLSTLLGSPANGCGPADLEPFLPPRYDGTQKGKGKLAALGWLSHIVRRGSPWPGSGISYTIPTPEVPELFGELSPTEVKYDDSPEGKLVRRFYDFVEAMMVMGDGGYQLEEDGAA